MIFIALPTLSIGLAMNLVNAFNDYGLKTNKTLDQHIWAQLNGDSALGDITGDSGNETSPSGNDSTKYTKGANLNYKVEDKKMFTNGKGEVEILGVIWGGFNAYTEVTAKIEEYYCTPTFHPEDLCEKSKQKINLLSIEEGIGTADIPTPPLQ